MSFLGKIYCYSLPTTLLVTCSTPVPLVFPSLFPVPRLSHSSPLPSSLSLAYTSRLPSTLPFSSPVPIVSPLPIPVPRLSHSSPFPFFLSLTCPSRQLSPLPCLSSIHLVSDILFHVLRLFLSSSLFPVLRLSNSSPIPSSLSLAFPSRLLFPLSCPTPIPLVSHLFTLSFARLSRLPSLFPVLRLSHSSPSRLPTTLSCPSPVPLDSLLSFLPANINYYKDQLCYHNSLEMAPALLVACSNCTKWIMFVSKPYTAW